MLACIYTTTPLFHALLANEDIQAGRYSIHWLENWLENWLAKELA